MMSLKDVLRFTRRRLRYDSPRVFLARMLRFGLVGFFYIRRNHKATSIKKNLDQFPVIPVLNFEMFVKRDDPGISTDLILDAVREQYITQELPKYLKQGQVAVDIGANLGYYALQEAKLVGSTGRVYAIEPIAENSSILYANVQRNGIKNTSIHKFAIGNENGYATIHKSELSNMCSMVRKVGYRTDYLSNVEVPIRTLDIFMADKPYPDLIRMDVEGYEIEVLKGAKELLVQPRPLALFIEIHFDILLDKVTELAKILTDNGFEVSVATFEAHMAVKNTWAMPILEWLDKEIGAPTGVVPFKVKNMLEPKYKLGQVEDLEVILERR